MSNAPAGSQNAPLVPNAPQTLAPLPGGPPGGSATFLIPVIACLATGLVTALVAYFALGRPLGTVEGQLTLLTSRVDRMAQAIPDLKIKLAEEELARPIESAIVMTKPHEASPGQWMAWVHLIDGANSKRTSYHVALASEKDDNLGYVLIGIGHDLEPTSVTGKELLESGATIKQPMVLPANINPRTTLCFYNTSADLLMQKLNDVPRINNPREASFDFHYGNWKTLLQKVNEGFGAQKGESKAR